MGEKRTRILEYAAAAGEPIRIPVAEVIGDRPGPTAVITAGVHGCEYPGIVSAVRLFKELRPEEVSGTVRIIPIVSTAAFEARSMFTAPADKKNLNRVFPGDKAGSYSEALAAYVMELVKGADFHIDIHGGDMVEELDPFSLYHLTASEKLNGGSYDITRYYGLKNVVVTTRGGLWPDDGTSYANVSESFGIPSAIVEVGAMGVLDEESVKAHLWGQKNVLRKFGVLAGEAVECPHPEIFENMSWVYTRQAGIFYLERSVGETIRKGERLGVLEDWFGAELETICAPVDGKILFLTGNPSMPEHGLIAGIGVAKKQ